MSDKLQSDYIIKIEFGDKAIINRKCPICLTSLEEERFIHNNIKDKKMILLWSDSRIGILCCLCRDILVDFLESMEKDKLLEIYQKGNEIFICFWFERIKNKGHFKFKIENLKRMLYYIDDKIQKKLRNYCRSELIKKGVFKNE